ncbi:hypothetical protein [Stenotrophomonas sp. 24(2023)]|uniref:hypothetical protein n=1 Tax=Stenotrophomonas sp. 24(2023) TaxID=3068324 RepID=UPI0027DF7A56|nr:hypothetical protein [Stenotrophomonas sp. 24(2023)]WMJ70643.1 hypothetical protein Q9R17_05960 [Stenotrophomonas sp. 24(2023)]
MNDVDRDRPDSLRTDFLPLLGWEEVMQDEQQDRLGFARRATLALLTKSGPALVEGFRRGGCEALGSAMVAVDTFDQQLREKAAMALLARDRLLRVAEALGWNGAPE